MKSKTREEMIRDIIHAIEEVEHARSLGDRNALYDAITDLLLKRDNFEEAE